MAQSLKQSLRFAAAFLGLWLGLKLLMPLMLPFLLGGLLALGAAPAAEFLRTRCRIPGGLAAALAVSALVCGLGLLALLAAALAVSQLSALSRNLPAMLQRVQSGIALVETRLLALGGSLPQGLREGYREMVAELFSGGSAALGKLSGAALGTAGTLLTRLPGSVITLGTALISGYMICAKLPTLKSWCLTRIPREKLQKWLAALHRFTGTGKLWLLSQLKLMGVTFTILLVGFWLLRVDSAPLAALLTTLVDALPVLGTGTVLMPWALLCFLGGQSARALGLLGLYATAALVRSVLEPRLVGSNLGLDPLVTLMAMYCGLRLWGLPGMLLLPLLTASAFQALPDGK